MILEFNVCIFLVLYKEQPEARVKILTLYLWSLTQQQWWESKGTKQGHAAVLHSMVGCEERIPSLGGCHGRALPEAAWDDFKGQSHYA